MSSQFNEKTNNPPPEGFPLMQGPQSGYSPSQGGYPPPHGDQPPITNQPVSQGGGPGSEWMNQPQTAANLPPGLEYLTLIDQLYLNRQPNLKDTIIGWVSKNKYIINNRVGERVYYAAEVSDDCSRNCWGSRRAFEMKILDNYGNEVISVNRPCACQHFCCPCCLQTIEVSSPPGTVVGSIEQQWGFFYTTFHVKNAAGDVVLYIRGPCCDSACCADVNFTIFSTSGDMEIGRVYKKWLGCGNQTYTDENVFGVEFPLDLDVRMKAVMLGACFLIEMMFFEVSGNLRGANRIRSLAAAVD